MRSLLRRFLYRLLSLEVLEVGVRSAHQRISGLEKQVAHMRKEIEELQRVSDSRGADDLQAALMGTPLTTEEIEDWQAGM